MIANQSGTAIQKTHYYPFGSAFAEGLGDGVQPYKYNGKELDKMHGLNMYDYSARHYDAAIGRFTTMDPHAENYYNNSPYAYVLNNPLKFIDPLGTDTLGVDELGNELWRIEAEGKEVRLGSAYPVVVTPNLLDNSKIDIDLPKYNAPDLREGGRLESLGEWDPIFIALTMGRSASLSSSSLMRTAIVPGGAVSATTQITKHALIRMAERGISKKMIKKQ